MASGGRAKNPVGTILMVVFAAACAVAAAYFTNISVQYLRSLGAGFVGEEFGTWWAAKRGEPLLGFSMGGVEGTITILLGIVAAIYAVEARDKARQPSLTDPMKSQGSAEFIPREKMAQFAHSSETYVYAFARKRGLLPRLFPEKQDWPKPEWCEKVEDDNLILSESARLSLSACPDRVFERNKHVVVQAGSGGGKTFNFLTSNILQLNSSLVFTDPKGEILALFGNFLEAHGYRLLVVNVQDEVGFNNSNRYNPIHYAKDSTALAGICTLLIENTTSDGEHPDWFTHAEFQLYLALYGYLYFNYRDLDESRCTLPAILSYLALAKSDGAQTAVTMLTRLILDVDGNTSSFEARLIERYGSAKAARKTEEWAVIENYRGFLTTAGSPETQASVLASCYTRLSPFTVAAVRKFFSDDELELEKLGDRKTALFILTNPQIGTYDFIASMIVYQINNVLTEHAKQCPGRHVPIPVNFYLDEVATIGKLPKLKENVAFNRSFWLNLIMLVQSKTDLEITYNEKQVEAIYNNAHTMVYLGMNDYTQAKKISDSMGTKTISYKERTRDIGSRKGGGTETVRYVAAPLMRPEEIEDGLEADECLVHIANAGWYRDYKSDPRKHRRWAELCATPKFDIESWASTRRAGREIKVGGAVRLPDGSVLVTDTGLRGFIKDEEADAA